MEQAKNIEFLSQRLKELRENNGYTLEEMASKIGEDEGGIAPNKSSLSRAEAGKTTGKTLEEMAKKYCRALKMNEKETDQFLRGKRIAVPDTSALIQNPQLIDQLDAEYSIVIIPGVVVDELTNIKNSHNNRYHPSLNVKAWEVLQSIHYGDRIIRKDPVGSIPDPNNNDAIIIQIAREASAEYHCQVEIITNDTDFSAYLKGDKDVMALHIKEYMANQNQFESVNMDHLISIDEYYADDYKNAEEPDENEIRAYLPDGNTLLIACVRRTNVPMEQRKAKIKWLIGIDEKYHGDQIKARKMPPLVDLRDRKDKYFPALTHAIQIYNKNKYQLEMIYFLLDTCKANPNVGSRNPHSVEKLRQKNEGNTPLMVAAWHGEEDVVRKLCKHPDISVNQQDANGFTALIKACYKGFAKCRDILINEGNADTRIVDLDGKNYQDHYDDYLARRYQQVQEARNNPINRNRRPY